jgi:hypothetical protein
MPTVQPDKVVTLTINSSGLPVPDQDPVQVKKDNQKIRWTAGFEFTIDIAEYPSSNLQYANGGGTYRCTSGSFSDVRKYKYSITANGVTNDPEIDIDPSP